MTDAKSYKLVHNCSATPVAGIRHSSKSTFLRARNKTAAERFVDFTGRFFAGHHWVFSGSYGFLFWFCFVSAVGLYAQEVSPPLTVTSVAQLQNLVGSKQRFNCSLALTGTVCTANAALGVLAVADNSGAEMFWLNFSGQELKAGQQLTLTATNCEVIRRRTGLAIQAAALVDNDGVHKLLEKSATVALEAGGHPIRLEWFKQYGDGDLSLEFSGPGIPRQNIPDVYLSHSNAEFFAGTTGVMPGLSFNAYAGSWPRLPDFSQWPLIESGVATNFQLGRWAGKSNVGLEFSGTLQVPRSRSYTFYLNSHDGSRLYLGGTEPAICVLGEEPVPEPRLHFIGSVNTDADTNQWAQFEGFVRFITKRSGRMKMEFRSSSNNRMELEVLDDSGLSAPLLMNSKILVKGVGRTVFSTGGQQIWGSLTVLDGRSLHIMEIASEVWATYPLRSPSEAIRELPQSEGEIFHVLGQLSATENAAPLVLKDAGASLLVERTGEAVALAGRQVEAIGICRRSGTNWCLSSVCLREHSAAGNGVKLPLLTTASQVAQLDRGESARHYPIHLRGVVTCVWPDYFRNFVLQDSTRGVFVQLKDAAAEVCEVHPGDFLEIQGYTSDGVFSPLVRAPNAKFLGNGRFPEPVHPAWDQLVNGSLDNQYVEIEGIITDIQKQSLTLLTHWGKISISITDQDLAGFENWENKLVRLRGCLLVLWDDQTHQIKTGGIRIQNAVVNVDESSPQEPFATPVKTLNQLKQFDVHAAAFRQVHVTGEIISQRGHEFFLMGNNLGLRFFANRADGIKTGDRVDVVGYPELGGPSPVLRDATVRKTGEEPLPAPKILGADTLAGAGLDAIRVQITATLLNRRLDRSEVILEMEAGLRPFLARYQGSEATLPSLRTGSRLELTGVYASLGNRNGAASDLDSFELLLDSPAAIRIISQPPWWTPKRLALAVGALALLLSLVALWVFQLRRQVDSQTKIIREKAEREATLEERTRIARELHDTLEQALAGISLQLRAFSDSLRELPADSARILSMARQMVRHGQDEARRTVRNLRTLALEKGGLPAALSEMARETSNGLPVKIEVEMVGTPMPLATKLESHLLRVSQEAMTNALKHANAKLIQISLHFEPTAVRLVVRDDGCGFDVTHAASSAAGHFGLLGMRERAEKIHGVLTITSQPDNGTIVAVTVPLGEAVAGLENNHEEEN